MVKIKTFQDMLFCFPSRLLPRTVNYSLSISIKTAEEWLFWAYTELLITPQVSDCDVPWLENNLGMLRNMQPNTLCSFAARAVLSNGNPKASRFQFFFFPEYFLQCCWKMEIATSPILLPLTGKDAPEGFFSDMTSKKHILSSTEQDHPISFTHTKA